MSDESLQRIRHSFDSGPPLGGGDWLERTAKLLEFNLVPRRRNRHLNRLSNQE